MPIEVKDYGHRMRGQANSEECRTKSKTSHRDKGANTDTLRRLDSSTLHSFNSSSLLFVAMMLSFTKLNLMGDVNIKVIIHKRKLG